MFHQSKVLLVDNNKYTSNVLSKILQKQRCNVTSLENGKDTINELKKHQYDLVIVETQLSDMNGIELLRQILKNDIKTKKIVLTGHPSEEDQEKSLELGADYYISKPIKPLKLLQLIKNCAIKSEK
jgi:CheY-like chemotaxis protein